MLRSQTKGAFFAVAAAILLFPLRCRTDTAAARVSNDQDTVLANARDFLHATYPELFHKGFFLQISTLQPIDESWRNIGKIQFQIDRYNPLSERMLNPPFDAKTGKRLSPPKNLVCQGAIWFTVDGRLDQFTIGNCAPARSKDKQAIDTLVESHPEWTEAQAFAALRSAGAQYGPENKNAFLKAIHLEKYEPFLGKFTIESVAFQGLSEPHEGSFASLYWSVELEVQLPDSKRTKYTFLFEPFSGKLIQVIHGLFRP